MSAVKMIFLKHIETFSKHIENNNKCAAVFRAVFLRGGRGVGGDVGQNHMQLVLTEYNPKFNL